MTELELLKKETQNFFKNYWNQSAIGIPPEWEEWNLEGEPKQAASGGCYAIFHNSKLLYIGVAVTEGKHSQSKGRKYGLLNRLKRHVLRRDPSNSERYIPKADKSQWKDVTSIWLIGFPDSDRCLAAALEVYLIQKIDTDVNAESKWRREHSSR